MTELSIIGPNITVASPKSVNATACRIANAIANACAVSTIICYYLFYYYSPSSSSEISRL
jgi:hypothetical protein